jgi:Flp pilus assembly protein TadG
VTRERGREDERGVTLILFTLMLTVLLVFVALALDTGLVYNEHRQSSR